MTEPGRPSSGRRSNPRRTMSLQLDSRTLATLQLVSAAIRRESGVALGMSGIVRALIQWLAEAKIDFRAIRTPEDLKIQLLSLLSADEAKESGDRE